MRADECLLRDQVLGIMHEHFGHGLTHRVRREKLAALLVMQFEAVVEHAEHIARLMREIHGEHAEEFRELLERFGFVLLHDGEVLRFSVGLVDGIRYVTEGDGRQFDEMVEGGEEMLARGELAEGVCEGDKVVMRRLRLGWLVTSVCGHRRWYPLWCSCRDMPCVKERTDVPALVTAW
jgi:hypothetical protein